MAQTCPACSAQNPDNSVYCLRCGTGLAPAGAGHPYGYQQQFMGQQGQQLVGQQGQYPSSQPLAQMGTAASGEDQWKFRRAFAGYGIPIMHHSWLLDGDQGHAVALYTAIMEILRQRSFLGFNLSTAQMKEKGYQTEERNYIVARRGVTTVFIYVAPAGRDLYISRATSVLPSIDIFRVILHCLLLGIALFGPTILTAIMLSSASNPESSSTPLILASVLASIFNLVSYVIWAYLITLVYRSFRYWLKEKDFWVYLRTRELNDFQLDDIALLEHATDETVLAAAKQLNLDASKIVPPKDYKPERRVKVF